MIVLTNFPFLLRFLHLVTLLLVMSVVSSQKVFAQNKPQETEYRLKKTTSSIVVDGVLDEVDWQNAHVASGFYMVIPHDDRKASYESEVRMLFDDEHFYIGIINFDNDKEPIVQSLRRDWSWPNNENFSIYIDPYNDFTNGFAFGITPYGAQREGTIDNGTDVNTDWDNKWYSQVQRYPDRWVAELKIPLKSIRYDENGLIWNIQFFRNHLKNNERTTWIAVEQQYTPSALTFSGKVIWPELPPKPGRNISFIPYSTVNSFRDKSLNLNGKPGADFGFDAKVSVTPALNLDITALPDFSQVEVDQQVINLNRFEFQFPERRQFFLENADLFGKFGFPNSRAFFSRRIGIATDTLGRTEQIPILFGARLSGKIGSQWRIGFLNMQTDQSDNLGLPYQNYSVLALQRQVFKRSNIAFVFVNKQSLDVDTNREGFYNPSLVRRQVSAGDTVSQFKLFNRVVGIEYNLLSEDTRWNGDFYYQQSFDEWSGTQNYNMGSFLRYQERNYGWFWAHTSVGQDFRADAGFVPRTGYHSATTGPTIISYPKTDRIITRQLEMRGEITGNPDFELTDASMAINYSVNYSNTSAFRMSAFRSHEKMIFDFNPIVPRGDSALVTGTSYTWDRIEASFESDRRKLFNFSGRTSYGGFYNGTRLNVNTNLTYRYQPYGSLGLSVDYNDLKMPEWIGEAKFFLIGPRLDVTFTDAFFFTTFVQYNNRFDNVNINSRIQWRFAPASDIFLVYTENYLPQTFFSKNRSLIFKITYWLNV